MRDQGVLKDLRRRLFTKGGVHLQSRRGTTSSLVFPGPNPEVVIIPMKQHVGAVCEPLVQVNDKVLVGQRIGDTDEYISAPIHSSVSGEVTGIIEYPHPDGNKVLSVQILSDGKNQLSPDISPCDPDVMTREEIRKVVRAGGIVGLGGSAFPTHVKLAPPRSKPITTVILNGAECEPYLTGDLRLMVERSSEIIKGGQIIKKAVGAAEIVVAVESDKPKAIQRMREAGAASGADVAVLPARYPMGAEKTLIHTVTGKEVPSGGLPMDVGVIVNNVGTCAAIYDLFYNGMPLVDRVVTVHGNGVAGHANLRIKIGSLVKDVIKYCGGFVGQQGKIIMGGPMMGLAQYTAGVPVIKNTSGIIVLRGETLLRQAPAHFVCIRCGRCVRRCPQNLMPYLIGSYADAGMWTNLEDLSIDDCMECGSCAYICPTKNPLVQLIKVGKEGFNRQKKKMEALSEARRDDQK